MSTIPLNESLNECSGLRALVDEMLETCNLALDYLNELDPGHLDRGVWDRLLAVINKAEGGL